MEAAKEYLLQYLQDEFRNYPEVRIRIPPFSDDPEVTVKTETREYAFPVEWMERKRMKDIEHLVRRIKDALPDPFR